MWKNTNILAFCLVLQLNAFAQTPSRDPAALAAEALVEARAGHQKEAIALYEQALAIDPTNIAILRDYAVVLGWSEKYSEAIAVVKKLRKLDNDQPTWALNEFARSYLFGGATAGALSILNELVEKGDTSETTLTRRALALRWLGRNEEALEAYRQALTSYPHSKDAVVGIAYSLADDNKHSQALKTLESTSGVDPNDIQIMKARIRILNWMGRHYEAQGVLARIPTAHASDREVLEDRISAARWGGDPVEAARELNTLSSMFPGESSSRLRKEFRTEFGHSFTPSIRYGQDSDGQIDRTAAADMGLHLNPAHVLRVGYQYRVLQQQEVREILRYDLGWTGTLHRRITAYATVSGLDYRKLTLNRQIIGDGALGVSVSDKVRLSGGGGTIIMDAYNAIPNQVTAPFGFGDVVFAPTSSTRLQARYSRFNFTNNVKRDRVDFEAMRSLVTESRVRFNLGWRTNLMWHDAQTNDFYSPFRFQSHQAVVQGAGRVTSWLEYSGEIAGGWQSEETAPILHPLQIAGKAVWRPARNFSATLEAGHSTSSVERPSAGFRTYRRQVVSASLQFRFP